MIAISHFRFSYHEKPPHFAMLKSIPYSVQAFVKNEVASLERKAVGCGKQANPACAECLQVCRLSPLQQEITTMTLPSDPVIS